MSVCMCRCACVGVRCVGVRVSVCVCRCACVGVRGAVCVFFFMLFFSGTEHPRGKPIEGAWPNG